MGDTLKNVACGAQQTAESVKPKARRSIHEVILHWFEKQVKGSILDAPAGFGHLSMKLKEMGFDVSCGEINPKIFAVPGMKCIYTDLNRRIDAPDCSFDYVACVDGLEHMTDPYQAVREFSRVLKPGGLAIFSIPNYSNIERRFKFLINGYFTKPISMESYEQAEGNLFDYHNSVLTVTVLEFIFNINRFHITEIIKNDVKYKQYIFYPFYLFLKFINFFRTKHKHEMRRTDLTLHPNVIMGGNNLIFILKKSED
jgi:SAM-dependent methyltransferase